VKPRNTALDNAVFELLTLILDSEEYARNAADELPPDSLGDSVPGKAAEAMLQAAANGEWESAPAAILTSLEMDGLDVSRLVEAIDLAASRKAEREAILEAMNNPASGPAPQPSCPAADPELCETFRKNTYNSSMRFILTDCYQRKRAALVEQAKSVPREDPAYAELVKEITELTTALLKLPKTYRVTV
jgi:hypothetical protein